MTDHQQVAWTAESTGEFRRHPFAFVGTLATIAAVLMLAVAFDHAVRQAKNPDSIAQQQCGGALGGAPPGAPDTSACYNAAVVRGPVDAAAWWLVGGIAGTVVVVGSAVGALVRRSHRA
jgi:hypothetical protein